MTDAAILRELPLEAAETEYQRAEQCVMHNWQYLNGRLVGDVRFHPRLGDADFVTTSRVMVMDVEEKWAVTKNTFYILKDKI